MPPKSRRHETPTGASTSDDTDVCSLQQCGNCVCPTRTNRNIRLFFVEVPKYADWGSDRPFICQTCTFHQCTPCGTAYSSLRGLSLHLRRSHEERYHQGEAEREVRKVRWDDGMLVRLAREEVRLKQQGVRYINQELQKCFPEYSIESIKGQRNKKTRYAQLLAEEYANADTVLETQTVQASTDSIVIEELVAIRRQMDLSLIFGEEVTDMNVAIDRGVLDTSLERLFPAVRKSNSGGANRQEVDLGDPSVTLTNHRRRRRFYKRVQRMFCRDRKRLMSGILQDSLEIKDSIPKGAEEF
ncbi:hypothetical protein EB796_014610 [Bugula neritina]|uniref:C2H2-type domain-containing protein n=1 Tax=Bugula neritina TaxID=10212 RepID=A0A7J7JNB1_BUGNE|nr:hypothetical protein EB796_014610 [Bugula neritina]